MNTYLIGLCTEYMKGGRINLKKKPPSFGANGSHDMFQVASKGNKIKTIG